ncbi:MAG: carboxypeptidase-like regulatory domain-containing protein [Chitinophagia bacterium]|nr:carboxypeptidase-like regulatory domain-containing protein [Chitinophagia bacterium]
MPVILGQARDTNIDMTRIALSLTLFLAATEGVTATPVTGKVRSEAGDPVPFASVTVKGGSQGTTSNAAGDYRLDLPPGSYVLYCGHVEYERTETRIIVTDKPLTRDFVLHPQTLTLGEVRVRPGGEDPAYAIIRKAIAQREYHRTRIRSWSCNAYVKGLLRLNNYPKSFMGQKVEFDDDDTTRKERILFLSETIAKVFYRQPEGQRIQVLSTRVSGRSDAFGLGSPQPVSFYEENVRLSSALNPRGFVSPIADNALYFYKYRYQGAFTEDGRLVNRIEVIPKRPYEPLFRGFIQIVEDDWDIHSLDLTLSKQSQMEFLDTLVLQQSYARVRGGFLMLQSQTLLPVFRQFGFRANGHFISVFSDYEVEPAFSKGLFGRTILRYDTASNRRTPEYWERLRPIPLLPEEQRDYVRKDSLRYLDSLDRRQNRVTATGILLTGQNFIRRRDSLSLSINPLLNDIGFNTVEGWMARVSGTLAKELPGRRRLSFTPVIRHGFGNGRTNIYATARYRYGTGLSRNFQLAGGRRVLQFNPANTVYLMSNTVNTLFYGNNFLKIYESAYADVSHTTGLRNGFSLQAGLQYQSRHLLQNTDTLTFWGRDASRRRFTPNLPSEAAAIGMPDHRALLATLSLTWRPGTRYIEFPDRTLSLSGRAPVINLSYTGGIRALGSEVDYGKWRLSVRDDVRLRLAGTFRYRVAAGGFLHAARVEYPDYRHFNGNQVPKAGEYLNTFQLARYYELATRDRLYTEIHAEHDFGGAITNKIPVVRKMNLRLMVGTNTLLTASDGNYAEVFVGLDNLFKTFRLDAIIARDRDGSTRTGIRLGVRGIDALLQED